MSSCDEFGEGFNSEVQANGVRQVAEARIFVCTYVGRPAIMKERNKIIVERIEGCTANSWIESRRLEKEGSGEFIADTLELGRTIGEAIGKMHLENFIHGDRTTSNIILRDGDFRRPFFIDFGLSSLGKVSSEDKGVDLFVLERALSSTHIDSEQMFDHILQGYQTINRKQGRAVITKLDEIRLRGRKRDMTG